MYTIKQQRLQNLHINKKINIYTIGFYGDPMVKKSNEESMLHTIDIENYLELKI